MHRIYQDLFYDSVMGKPLKFEGETGAEGSWLNGILINAAGQQAARIENSIAVWDCNDPWTEENWDEIDAGLIPHGFDHTTLIPLRWCEMSRAAEMYPIQMKYLEKVSGLILEIASGPGGGFAPMVLKHNPNAKLMFNDIGIWLLQEWQKLKDKIDVDVYYGKEHGIHQFKKDIWPNVAFARFDFNQPPLKKESFDCVTSLSGLSNVVNWTHSLSIVHKILKSGGLLIMQDSEIAVECLTGLTEEHRRKIADLHRGFNMEYDQKYYDADFRVRDLVEQSGFEILEFEYGRKYDNDGSNGDYIPKLFTEMGIKFAFQDFHLIAKKR